ncbi:MAG: bifunctional protein-serine/threonine kinase/phosphatase [Gammaproteobacteria bacterium]|nr:bifunctional protein-serine/threonine kinase/phosphatase [Gammaproteobacteria bacterium]MBL6999520.1 bifunctional protein-serine/threonine kinase/phosphatase [Gammaproteobacteria bacterium]
MSSQLKISVGQHSDKGRKQINQDFYGVYIPQQPQLSSKGIAIALADGISSSDVSQIASEASVSGFLEDYFSTSETWSVKKSAHCVLMATNSWLHSQTQQSQHRYNKDKGYVCTFSAIVIKSTTAHILHVGDSRIYRVQGETLEQLTEDHRFWISQEKSYLSRAMGINQQLEIDYRTLAVEPGELFILATDGVYEFASADDIIQAIRQHPQDLDKATQLIVERAYAQQSTDNLTIQIIRVDELPAQDASEIYQQLTELPFAPILEARAAFDGYQIMREVHATSRSHIYLARDAATDQQVILKIPSIDLRADPAYLERFMLEEWIARRIDSAHVLKPCQQTRKRNFIYIVSEYIDGRTLTQWMIDNPDPDVETVRGIIEQIARGLLAFHRLEMLHQDLRPNNIMIDTSGTVKIIDFGSTRVAGLMEMDTPLERNNLLGTAQYSAPEYFLGESGSARSDLFSLAVIAYQMLSGRLPYGAEVAKARTRAAQRKLNYQSVLDDEREIPAWIDAALRKALHPDPYRRYAEISEFVFDLRHPNKTFLSQNRPPIMERNPLLFWKSVAFILSVIIALLMLR